MTNNNDPGMSRREFVQHATTGMLLASIPEILQAAAGDKAAVLAKVPGLHDRNLERLRDWIALPSIAAENRNNPQGAEYMRKLALEAGFKNARLVPTSGGIPGVFGTRDEGAKTTLAVYCMYDVKQFTPSEWSSPPLEGRLVEKPGLGTVCMGRGAYNSKGPQSAFLSALAAFDAAGKKLPVNLVLICEGEEEIASPHFGEIINQAEILARLRPCIGVLSPNANQKLDGSVELTAGAKGVVELELVSDGASWGRGPARADIHSSYEAQVDSPAWHLVQALNTLVEKDGHTPAVEGFFDRVKPLSAKQKAMVVAYASALPEKTVKDEFAVAHWVKDEDWQTSLMRLFSQSTINIQGLVGGYTGVGGKTILPHRAVAKIDMRLVPDMTAADTLDKLKQHLTKRGFGDIEVNVSGGYDPTQTDPDSPYFRAVLSTFTKLGVTPLVAPRSPGSWPGYRFTSPPLSLPTGGFGLGYGSGAHAPDEFYLIDSKNPAVSGLDGAVASFIEFLYAVA
jgi:acetylornithine deacetylase/succinyl-diaminopimelate desuccinylase-like protein